MSKYGNMSIKLSLTTDELVQIGQKRLSDIVRDSHQFDREKPIIEASTDQAGSVRTLTFTFLKKEGA